MEAFLAQADLLFNFLQTGDNWLIAILLGFALSGIIEGLTRLFQTILPWNKPDVIQGPTGPMGPAGKDCECRCKN